MEGPGVAWIPSGVGSSNLTYLVTHEVAHQWFYGIVGNDQAREPFADEAMTDFVARYVLGMRRARAARRRRSTARSTSYSSLLLRAGLHPGRQPHRQRAQEDGLDRLLGEPLRGYIADHRWGLSHTRTLLDALDDATSLNLGSWWGRGSPAVLSTDGMGGGRRRPDPGALARPTTARPVRRSTRRTWRRRAISFEVVPADGRGDGRPDRQGDGALAVGRGRGRRRRPGIRVRDPPPRACRRRPDDRATCTSTASSTAGLGPGRDGGAHRRPAAQGFHLLVAGSRPPTPGRSASTGRWASGAIGEFEAIGWKSDAWHGVEFWGLELAARPRAGPGPPRSATCRDAGARGRARGPRRDLMVGHGHHRPA